MEMIQSPAGCDPVIGENVHLKAAVAENEKAMVALRQSCKEATAAEIAKIPTELIGTKKFSQEIDRVTQQNAPGTRPEYKQRLAEKVWLMKGAGYDLVGSEWIKNRPPAIEIVCPESGFHIWAKTREEAIVDWNKAVEKLATLEECCLDPDNHQPRVTDAGFTLVRCNVCSRRHVPFQQEVSLE